MRPLRISVFLPAFNEETNIKKTIAQVDDVLQKIAADYEILVINDGSWDETVQIVKGLAKRNKKIRMITHSKNKGYGAAIKSGLYNVRFPWVVQMDSDGQFDFGEIKKFLAKMNKADLIIGYRMKRTDGLYRRFMAKVLWLADLLLFGLNVKEVDCGFKFFKKEIIEKIPQLRTGSAITVTEFVVRARQAGFRIAQVGVRHFSRKNGEQTGGKPGIILKAALQGILLWFSLSKEKILKLEIFFLFLILLAAAFLRLFKIRDYIVFLGDQGRDALVAKQILVDRKLTLLGPTASVGGFYLGPFYYYLMTLPLWLAGLDPVGPAIMVALFGVATVFLIYCFVKKTFGSSAALFAACLYGLSPLAATNSRFSWNPNTLPFFSLVYFFFLWLAGKRKERWFLFFAGLALGICFQLHYLALILAPLGLILTFRKKFRHWCLNALILVLSTLVSFSPFLFFELRHGFPNFRTIWEFVTRKGGTIAFYPFSLFPRFSELSMRIFAAIFGLEKELFVKGLVYFTLFVLFSKFLKKGKKWISFVLLVWWMGGIILLSLYQGTIYNYYYGYLYPLPVIVLGLSLDFLWKRKFFVFRIFSLGILGFILFFSVKKQKIWQKPNRILDQTERIVESIIEESRGKPFNLALVSPGNSDHAYRYFLEIAGYKPTALEEQVEEQLFVVCEDAECQPLGHPLWEIAGFGRAEITRAWTDKVGIKIFRLVHHQDSMDWIGKPAPKGE